MSVIKKIAALAVITTLFTSCSSTGFIIFSAGGALEIEECWKD